jgi:hypothetical protein
MRFITLFTILVSISLRLNSQTAITLQINPIFTVNTSPSSITLTNTSSNLSLMGNQYIPTGTDGSIKVTYSQNQPLRTKVGFGLGIVENCRVHTFKNSYLIMIDDYYNLKVFKPITLNPDGSEPPVEPFARCWGEPNKYDAAGQTYEIKKVGNQIQFYRNGEPIIDCQTSQVASVTDASLTSKNIVPIIVYYDDPQSYPKSGSLDPNYTVSSTINISAQSTGTTILTPTTLYNNCIATPTNNGIDIFASAQCDQIFNFNTANGSNNSIQFNPNSNLGVETEILTNAIYSKQIGANEDGGIEFEVSQYQATDNFSIGFKSSDNKTYYFSFASNDVKILNNGNVVTPSPLVPSRNGRFSIAKVGNTLNFYNGIFLVGSVNLVSNVTLTMDYVPSSSINANIVLCFKRTSASDGVEGETFIVLKRDIDASYAKLIDDKIRIQFRGDYNSTDDEARIKIFDKKRNILLDQKLTNCKVGTNFKQIGLSNLSFNNNEVYTLELTANKGEKYCTRFLPVGGSAPTPFVVIPPIINKNAIPDITINCVSEIPTATPTVTDGYTGAPVSLSYTKETMSKIGCINCLEKVLRIWEGQDSKCYPVKVVQVVTINDVTPPIFTSTIPPHSTISCLGTLPPLFNTLPTATDCNASAKVVEEQIISYETQGEVTTYLWTAIDDCGNKTVATARVLRANGCPTIDVVKGFPADKQIVNPVVSCNAFSLIPASYTCTPTPTQIGATINVEANDPKILLISECLKDDIPPIATDDCDVTLNMTIKYSIKCDVGGYYVFKKWIFTDRNNRWSYYTQIIKVFSPTTQLLIRTVPSATPLANNEVERTVSSCNPTNSGS